jgi:hypothetical protein
LVTAKESFHHSRENLLRQGAIHFVFAACFEANLRNLFASAVSMETDGSRDARLNSGSHCFKQQGGILK